MKKRRHFMRVGITSSAEKKMLVMRKTPTHTMLQECLCAYIASHMPSLNDIIAAIRSNEVCTASQCFENHERAGFGSPPVAGGDDSDWMFAAVVASCVIGASVCAIGKKKMLVSK